jgi:hypothetical protein
VLRKRRLATFSSFARLLLLACLVTVPAVTTGCRDRYVVRHAASPNPLKQVRRFALEPLAFDVRVDGKPEVDWLAKAPEDKRAHWPAGKTAMIAAFQRGLASDAQSSGITIEQTPAKEGTNRIRATVRHVETGLFAGPTSSDTMVEIDVEILSPDGKVIDAITSRASVPATALNLELEDRLRDAAKDVGENVARYLKERTAD